MQVHKLALLGAVIVSQAALAQAPLPSAAPVPEKLPFDIPIGAAIGLDKAKELISAVEADARKRGWKMAISVVDATGELVAFEKMDDTQYAAIPIAQAKARTAARFRRSTAVFYDAIETGHPSIALIDPTVVGIPGGFPLVENGKLVGGIGCSGGMALQDAAVCKVGADKLQ